MKKYVCPVIIGIVFGTLAKIVDFFPSNSIVGYLGLKDIMNYFGAFIVIVCFIEYRSQNTKQGIIYTLEFMLSMIISYYYVHFLRYHFWAWQYIILWCILGFCSPLLYLCISLRKKQGKIVLLGTLAPVLLLGNEAFTFIETMSVRKFQFWFDIIAIIFVFWKLPIKTKDRVYSIIAFILLVPFLDLLDVIRKIANGLYGLLL